MNSTDQFYTVLWLIGIVMIIYRHMKMKKARGQLGKCLYMDANVPYLRILLSVLYIALFAFRLYNMENIFVLETLILIVLVIVGIADSIYKFKTRVGIYEEGLLATEETIKWEELISFEWIKDNKETLQLQVLFEKEVIKIQTKSYFLLNVKKSDKKLIENMLKAHAKHKK